MLLIIFIILLIFVIIGVMVVSAHNAKEQKEIEDQPKRIQKKSDAPNTED